MTPYLEEANLGVLRQVASGERILDVGCGRGRLGQEMRARGNVVHGIELDSEAAEVAATRLELVHCGDATDRESLPEPIRSGSYDAIVFADVLEQVVARSPGSVHAAALAAPGRIIVSLPNVASWPVRLGLLFGHFDIETPACSTGRAVFTLRSARALLSEAGFGSMPRTRRLTSRERPSPSLGVSSRPSPTRGALVDSPAYAPTHSG
jgi:SAM-dependent methyltransferase